MFFDAISDRANRLRRLDQRVIVNTILNRKEFKDFIIALNTEGEPTSQLFELNVDSKGVQLSAIGGNYSPFTLENSATPKKSLSAINLKDSGDYYKSFKVSISSLKADFITITSDPIKDEDNLEDRWGEHLEGLTEQNLELLQEKILKELIPLIALAL